MMQLPSLRRLTLCLVLGASVLPTVPAHAQLGMQAGFVEAFQPDFLHRDMDLFRQYLLLEEWQQPIVESLLKDYLADFKIGTDGLRDTMKNMKDQIIAAGDQGAIGVIMGPIDRWIEEKARLKGRFVDNLRSQLSEEQMNHWVDLERAMRREKELPRGELSGEAIDLSLISRTVDVPPEVLEISDRNRKLRTRWALMRRLPHAPSRSPHRNRSSRRRWFDRITKQASRSWS